MKAAQLPQIWFHDLRHSAATIMLSNGVPMKVVQEILGHSNFSTTANVYAHVLPAMQKEAAAKMDELFAPVASRLASNQAGTRPN
jgi:integrase